MPPIIHGFDHSAGGVGGAPVGAPFVTTAADLTLTNESVLTQGNGITVTVAGGLATVALVPGTAQYQYLTTGVGPGFVPAWSTGFLNITAAQTLAITTGGSLALGGFTGTLPATGKFALMDYANTTNFGVGVTPTENIQVAGNIRIPVTTATVGIIKQGADRLLHSYGTANLFLGINAGNLAFIGVWNIGIGNGVLTSMTNASANTAVGYTALTLLATGTENTAVGCGAMTTANGAVGNSVFGASAGNAITNGSGNTLIGTGAGSITSGGRNVMVGNSAGFGITTGSDNTVLGNAAGYTGAAAQSGCVLVGKSAGYYETGNNKFFIDNVSRASEADGRLKALIYGIFDAAVASQRLTFNAGYMGFFATPAVVQSTGWSVNSGYTADKIFDPESTTELEIGRVLGTLIDALKTYGLLGA